MKLLAIFASAAVVAVVSVLITRKAIKNSREEDELAYLARRDAIRPDGALDHLQAHSLGPIRSRKNFDRDPGV